MYICYYNVSFPCALLFATQIHTNTSPAKAKSGCKHGDLWVIRLPAHAQRTTRLLSYSYIYMEIFRLPRHSGCTMDCIEVETISHRDFNVAAPLDCFRAECTFFFLVYCNALRSKNAPTSSKTHVD